MSEDFEVSITFKTSRGIRDKLNLFARRHGHPLSSFLRAWTEEHLLIDMTLEKRRAVGFFGTAQCIQSNLTTDEWQSAKKQHHPKEKRSVIPLVYQDQ